MVSMQGRSIFIRLLRCKLHMISWQPDDCQPLSETRCDSNHLLDSPSSRGLRHERGLYSLPAWIGEQRWQSSLKKRTTDWVLIFLQNLEKTLVNETTEVARVFARKPTNTTSGAGMWQKRSGKQEGTTLSEYWFWDLLKNCQGLIWNRSRNLWKWSLYDGWVAYLCIWSKQSARFQEVLERQWHFWRPKQCQNSN